MGWIETYMNEPAHKVELGVNPSLRYETSSAEVNQAFTRQGDGMHNSALLLTDLVNDGIRLLVYAGNAGGFHLLTSTSPTMKVNDNALIL